MRHLLLLPPLTLLAGCYYYPPPPPPPYYYSPMYYPPPAGFGTAQPARPSYPARPGAGPAYSQENCGTPDQFKPCPPLPRNPLPYYPANRP